jgi:hypothetical protein
VWALDAYCTILSHILTSGFVSRTLCPVSQQTMCPDPSRPTCLEVGTDSHAPRDLALLFLVTPVRQILRVKFGILLQIWVSRQWQCIDTMSGNVLIISMNCLSFCCVSAPCAYVRFVPLGNLTTELGVGSAGGWAGSSKPTTPMNGTPRAGSPINLGSSPQHRPSSWTPQVNIITRLLPPNIISRRKGN